MSSGRYPYVASNPNTVLDSIHFRGVELLAYLSARSYTDIVLVGVKEPATVRYPDEQCTTSAGVNEGLCNLCCSLGCGDDDNLVGWKGFFDVGEADMVACEPMQQIS